jgi:NAD(P)-dependent dehydrogenase (short-subunit alcohol dehydrogenase family)
MNKMAIITGSSGGIGWALVDTYLSDGYLVFGLDKNPLKQDDIEGFTQITTNLLSLAKDKEYRDKIINEIRSGLPKLIDDFIVVNNAAEQILNSVEEITWDDWERSIGVNTIAPFFLIQSLIDLLVVSRGHIINVTSIHAKQTKQVFSCYAASKAALESLTRSLAIELSPQGVSINSIAPAAIGTEMLLEGFAGNPEKLKELKDFHPAKKIGRPEDLASFIKAVTDQKGGFLTGATLEFDGGISGRLYDPN